MVVIEVQCMRGIILHQAPCHSIVVTCIEVQELNVNRWFISTEVSLKTSRPRYFHYTKISPGRLFALYQDCCKIECGMLSTQQNHNVAKNVIKWGLSSQEQRTYHHKFRSIAWACLRVDNNNKLLAARIACRMYEAERSGSAASVRDWSGWQAAETRILNRLLLLSRTIYLPEFIPKYICSSGIANCSLHNKFAWGVIWVMLASLWYRIISFNGFHCIEFRVYIQFLRAGFSIKTT